MNYPVYIHQEQDGSASGFFPCVTGCYFAGDSIEDALNDAASALDAHLEALVDLGIDVPVPSPINAYRDSEDCTGGAWGLVNIDLGKFEGRAQKINITLPELLIAKIDDFVKANHEYGSRSGFLAIAARHEMKHI